MRKTGTERTKRRATYIGWWWGTNRAISSHPYGASKIWLFLCQNQAILTGWSQSGDPTWNPFCGPYPILWPFWTRKVLKIAIFWPVLRRWPMAEKIPSVNIWHPWFGPLGNTFGCLEVSFADNPLLSLTRCFRGTSSFEIINHPLTRWLTDWCNY